MVECFCSSRKMAHVLQRSLDSIPMMELPHENIDLIPTAERLACHH